MWRADEASGKPGASARFRHSLEVLVTAAPTTTAIDHSFVTVDYRRAFALGYRAMIGYLPWDANTVEAGCLSKARIAAVHEAGLGWLPVWEVNETRPLSGYNVGLSDGITAAKSAIGLGAPPGTPVFWACDFEANPLTVLAYGQGFAKGVHDAGLQVGVYGSFAVVDFFRNNGWALWGWQAEAWSYGRVTSQAHLIQRIYDKKIPNTDHNDILSPLPFVVTDSTHLDATWVTAINNNTEGDMDTIVLSDNGSVWIVGGGVKRPLVSAPTWDDTAWAINELVRQKVIAAYLTGPIVNGQAKGVPQGALNIIPDAPPAQIAVNAQDVAGYVIAELQKVAGPAPDGAELTAPQIEQAVAAVLQRTALTVH